MLPILRLLSLLLLSALAGCASMDTLKQELSASAELENFEQVNYRPLTSGVPLNIAINRQLQSHRFDSGKSYVAGLQLPAERKPYLLEVNTYYSSDFLSQAHIFVPRFIFLDAQKNIMTTLKQYRLDLHSSYSRGGYFNASIAIPAQAAFVLIYGDEDPQPALMLLGANGDEFTIPHAPAGELSLTLSQPLPADYDFSTVLIKDSLTAHSNKTDFFAVRKINGMMFPNSFAKTLASKQNGATDMRPFLIDREVPARTMTLELMARTLYTPSLLNFTSKVNRVTGEITFTPEANKSYVVKGIVEEDYAAVWLEEESSGKMVSEKIEHHGPATLGILQK